MIIIIIAWRLDHKIIENNELEIALEAADKTVDAMGERFKKSEMRLMKLKQNMDKIQKEQTRAYKKIKEITNEDEFFEFMKESFK